MLVQAGLCQTCSETTLLVFPQGGSNQIFTIMLKKKHKKTNKQGFRLFDDVRFQNDCGGDRVCISGISCRLPQARNMSEFRENLQNGADMVTTGDQMVNENNGNSGHMMKTHQGKMSV